MMKIKAVKVRKPTTSAQRGMSFVNRDNLSKVKPVRSLTKWHKRSSGRDVMGHVSIRHKGGGAKRKYRTISTIENCGQGPFEVMQLEYDPYRSAHIALIKNAQGKLYYILAPKKTEIKDIIEVGEKASINPGNRKAIGSIPTGIAIHALEIYPNSRAKMIKAAGVSAVIMSHEGNSSLIKLPSGEIRKFDNKCLASIGILSNEAHNTIKIGKAGRVRHMGIRPTVRGKVMHPAAHPHGGGEGVNPIGLKAPKTPWGKKAIGAKTRRKFNTGGFIIKSRHKKKR